MMIITYLHDTYEWEWECVYTIWLKLIAHRHRFQCNGPNSSVGIHKRMLSMNKCQPISRVNLTNFIWVERLVRRFCIQFGYIHRFRAEILISNLIRTYIAYNFMYTTDEILNWRRIHVSIHINAWMHVT